MHFLFVGSGFCLRLPSDSISRWTPLSSANSSHCQACRGLSPPRFTPCWAHPHRPHRSRCGPPLRRNSPGGPRCEAAEVQVPLEEDDRPVQRRLHREIRTRIADVAASARRRIVLVDPRGTSQICSGCGRVVRKGLGTRVHSCPGCGLVMDRDVNAAINIINRGWACHPDPVRWSNRPALGHIERYSAKSSFI